jgi:hypothetical protein
MPHNSLCANLLSLMAGQRKLALFRTEAPGLQSGGDPLGGGPCCSLDTSHFKLATPPKLALFDTPIPSMLSGELALFRTAGLRPGSKSGVTTLPTGDSRNWLCLFAQAHQPDCRANWLCLYSGLPTGYRLPATAFWLCFARQVFGYRPADPRNWVCFARIFAAEVRRV